MQNGLEEENWLIDSKYLLFPRKDVLIEKVLNLFISYVDAKLFERIGSTGRSVILKAENVQ